MKTTTYARVLEQAMRLAFRTGTLVPEEAKSLRSFLDIALTAAWTSRWWPDLAAIAEMTPVNQLIDRNLNTSSSSLPPGSVLPDPEIGLVIGVYSADPRTAPNYKLYPFSEHGEYIVVHTTAATVWVEYMPPPTDLASRTEEQLPTTLIPDLFTTGIAHKAAGNLLLADGLSDQGNRRLNEGDKELENLVLNLNFPRWWTRVTVNHCQ